jgi:hypothetical protein
MATLPIAQLEQRRPDSTSESIRAVVTLIWPYSSSTQRAALLLAEPDFRLRKSKGQVRVQLAGAAARELARSKIASGDEVVLSLQGARWVDASVGGVSTPGRSVDIELEYKRRIACEVCDPYARTCFAYVLMCDLCADIAQWQGNQEPRCRRPFAFRASKSCWLARDAVCIFEKATIYTVSRTY